MIGRFLSFSFLILVFAAMLPLSAAPIITSIANAASNIGFGPSGGIAQGAIFVIKGSGLGPADISLAPSAFQTTTLSGTSVSVTVAGTTTIKALLYYTSANQVAALLPSNTPGGPAAFTVTYNGETSAPVNHGVVSNNLAIFTIDSTGQGPGVVTYADYSLVSAAKASPCGGPNTACGAANPGDTLILWGTGLGGVNGDDASGTGLGQAMPNILLTLWLGGVQAPVIYQGRSGCCIGEDQIVFTVPDGVPTGCAVPLVVQIGIEISNSVVMPVAHGSRDCTPSNAALASVNIEQAVMAGPLTVADLQLRHDLIGASPPVFEDKARFDFFTIGGYSPGSQPFFTSWVDDQPLGTCITSADRDAFGNPPIGELNPIDAGSNFNVSGPGGNTPVGGGGPGGAHATLSATGKYLSPGPYTLSGTGGANVGPFSATIMYPAAPTLVSPADNAMVTRSNGLTVTWTGGSPNANVSIEVIGAVEPTFTLAVLATCTAPGSAGTFTIPPYVMLALPTGNLGGLVLKPKVPDVAFTAPGIGIGFAEALHDGTGYGYGAGKGNFGLR